MNSTPSTLSARSGFARRHGKLMVLWRRDGAQWCGPLSNALLGPDILGPTRRCLDGDRLESVVAQIIGAGTHIQRTGIRGEFQDTTWRAFFMTAVEAKNPREVAAALNLSPGAVYVAKSRVLARLRQEVQQMQED